MTIGIVASSAFNPERTGVEEYTFQLIHHLTKLKEAESHRFFLYVKARKSDFRDTIKILPSNFILKSLSAPLFWTQGRLALELKKNKPDIFFSPGHVLPRFHPENSVVTIHGLEFERYPQFYPKIHRFYLRTVSKYAVSHAKKIIAVSENTKNDLMELYRVPEEKITVVYHGASNQRKRSNEQRTIKNKYILFLGRQEKKKNISGLIKAFNLLKEKYKLPHQLIITGAKPDQRYYRTENFKRVLKKSKFKKDIKIFDYISETEKWNLLRNAEVFIYPSFYEGFGIPALEAQSAGTPVITSNTSALPEIAGEGAILINPYDIEEISKALYKVIGSDDNFSQNLIRRGYQNIKRFSWEKCARETLKVLLEI